MKKLTLLIAAICILSNVNAQDVIFKKTGEEINAKITEVGIDNVMYKKYENIEGPTYTIPKYEIFMILYENGSKDVFEDKKPPAPVKEVIEVNEQREYIRKGMHLGLHVTPGLGTVLLEWKNNRTFYEFGMSGGVDLCVYFNDYVGIKTGFSYLSLPVKYKYSVVDPVVGWYVDTALGSVKSVGIPIKFVITTGNKFGFYLESGINVYMPISSNVNEDYASFPHEFTGNHMSLVLVEETIIGLNIKSSEKLSINLGASVNYSLTNFFNENAKSGGSTKGVLFGLQVGMLYKLKKE